MVLRGEGQRLTSPVTRAPKQPLPRTAKETLMLTTVDTLMILTGFALCWIGAAIALDRIITIIARHVR